MSSSSFSQIRSQALSLEKQTESLLSKYSQYQQSSSQSLESTEDESHTKQQINDILGKRTTIINKLNRISESSINESSLSTSKLQQISRHREILQDHWRAFNRITSQLTDERNRNNLLFSVQSDISYHKQQHQRRPGQAGSTEINDDPNAYILEESQRADNVNSIADRLLQGAMNTRDELINQRQFLQNAQVRIMSSLQGVPGINVLISKINTRRKRDTLILASVIAICIVLLFFV
ncbi:GOS1 [Candida oxycetoniae]|uniref:Golgi SNAP receptor complex member 1 n=1 Tax=Candida oxycetoniae TaxID=497107 RepID=A0AAI9T0S5_9ASCO|nr:GOS1 [Candida oxycetoniae]KAI3406522.2 GOS1 [Candida oxycetoniae]